MAKYLLLWEVDTIRTPDDPKAKKGQLLGFDTLVMKQLKEGAFKEFGIFAGEMKGYCIFEGTSVDLHSFATMWVPAARFTVREVLTVEQANKANKALPE